MVLARPSIAACGLTLLLALAACSNGSSGAEPEGLPGRAVSEGLCRAASQAPGDPAAAEETFASVHDALHTVARAVQDVDRAAAADLLEAKQAVESGFAEDAGGAALSDGLGELAAATRAGLARLGLAVPGCGAEPEP